MRLAIEDVAYGGDGVARDPACGVVFVPGAFVGEVVEAECVDTDGGKHHVSYTGPYDFGSVTDPYSVPGAGSLAGTVSPGAVKSRPVMSRRHVGDGRAHAAIFFATFVGR